MRAGALARQRRWCYTSCDIMPKHRKHPLPPSVQLSLFAEIASLVWICPELNGWRYYGDGGLARSVRPRPAGPAMGPHRHRGHPRQMSPRLSRSYRMKPSRRLARPAKAAEKVALAVRPEGKKPKDALPPDGVRKGHAKPPSPAPQTGM
jgi:hypothetical protein